MASGTLPQKVHWTAATTAPGSVVRPAPAASTGIASAASAAAAGARMPRLAGTASGMAGRQMWTGEQGCRLSCCCTPGWFVCSSPYQAVMSVQDYCSCRSDCSNVFGSPALSTAAMMQAQICMCALGTSQCSPHEQRVCSQGQCPLQVS